MFDRPSRRTDVLAFLQWEYDRLRLLTMLPSSRFHYSGRDGDEGADTSTFCFSSIYGDGDGVRRTVSVDGDNALSHCTTRFINPLKRMQTAFISTGRLPFSCNFKEDDNTNDKDRQINMLKAQYILDVLVGWFTRVHAVLSALQQDKHTQGLVVVERFVPETTLLQTAWEWANRLVNDYRNGHGEGSDDIPEHIRFLVGCVTEIARPEDEDADPGGWRFTREAQRTIAQSPTTPVRAQVSPVARSPITESQQMPSLDSQLTEPGILFENLEVPDDDSQAAEKRSMPAVPSHAPSHAQDMSAIQGVDLLDLIFTDIPMISAIPTAYWEQWARANTVVYKWVESGCTRGFG